MNAKIALITGGGSGVRLACAQAPAADCFTLVLSGRRQGALDRAIVTLEGRGHLAIAADVGREDDVATLFARIEEAFGRLDLLFNNAGRNAPAVDMTTCRWRRGTRSSPPISPARFCALARVSR